jgi:pimeloyl-ACP methyl ester carboxylesterase
MPGLILQGEQDRFTTSAAALLMAKVRPAWTYRELDGLGHTPHLEDPMRTAQVIWEWLDSKGQDAVARTRTTPAVEAG